MSKIKNGLKKLFAIMMNDKVHVKIGLTLTSLYTLITFIFAALYYLMGSLDKAMFWAIMMVGSEVSFVGLRVVEASYDKSPTYTTNVTLDMSKVSSPDKFIEEIKGHIKAKSNN